jgi:hypothetical protein
MRKCFNGHRKERRGCAGCHHAWHVVAPGTVADGELKPPVVNGPDDCAMCHRMRHRALVDGCTQCEELFDDVLHDAMVAAKPVRSEIMELQFLHWFVGWQSRLAGWFGLIAGTQVADWFKNADGSQNWFQLFLAVSAVPLIQWAIKRRIDKRERLLPQLGPKGEIVYGEEPADH